MSGWGLFLIVVVWVLLVLGFASFLHVGSTDEKDD